MWVRLNKLKLCHYGQKSFTYNFRSIMRAQPFRKCSYCGSSWLSECPLHEFLWILVPNIALYFTLYLSLIWFSCPVMLYIWNLWRVFIILPFLVMFKISIISSIGAMGCFLSVRCCANLRLSISMLKVSGMFLRPYRKRPASLSDIFFIAVMTC